MINGDKIKSSVLYVEDDTLIRENMERVLKKKIEHLYLAVDGLDGLSKFEEHKPEIVITDIKMPNLTGLEMIEKIKELSPDTPIVITTAFGDVDHLLKSIDIGVDKFVLKPINFQKLLDSVIVLSQKVELKKELKNKNRLLEEYKKAVDVSAIVSKTDKNGIITYVNDEFCKTSLFDKDEAIGKSHNIVRHPNTKREVFEELWSTILDKRIWRGIIENRDKNGESYFVDTKIVPILDENEEIVEFIGIRIDITELIKKQNEIERMRILQIKDSIVKASDIRLESIIESIPTPSFIVDSSDIIIFSNQRFKNIFDIYEDSSILKRLKNLELKFKDLIRDCREQSEYDEFLDLKSVIENIHYDEDFVSTLMMSDTDREFNIKIKRAEIENSVEPRYVVCLVELKG